MSSYEGSRAIAIFLNDCEGCTFLVTTVGEAIAHAKQGFGEPVAPDTYAKQNSEGHGVCECKNVGATVYMAIYPDDLVDGAPEGGDEISFHGIPTVARIEVTNFWWTKCAVLNNNLTFQVK